MTTFGRLKQIDLRHGWPLEDRDFTPWLGEPENLALLSETIGLDLEPLHQEHPVGPFRADLVCQDSDAETMVLIENQLEKTNHTHLGQLLTYAAGLQAVTIVWIARRFTDEHQAALTWLNEHTGEDIRFFGLEIELWQIGDSDFAPKFNIVARPNDWVKEAAASRSGETNERKSGQRAYWAGFIDWYATHGDGTLGLPSPHGRHWLSFGGYGVSGFRNSLTLHSGREEVAVELYLRGRHAKARFAALEGRRSEIEAAFGGELEWMPLPEKIACRIKATLPDADWRNEQDRPRQYEWLARHMEDLMRAVTPFVREAADAAADMDSEEDLEDESADDS